jgi:hypothetical protein
MGAGAALAEPGKLSVELNKLEAQDKGCRAFLVINNQSETAYKSVKLDLVMFRTDGIIGKRFAIDLAPMKANKRSVKSFDLQDTPCDQVGSLLINEVMDCASEAGPVGDCLAGLNLSSLSKVQLSK